MSLGITEEIIARQSPEAQAIIRLLLAEIVRLEARIRELEGGRKTPQNSSLPPSSVHPHAKPASSKRKSKKKRGGQPGHEKHERALRHAVIWRKLSFGTQSASGSRFVETMLTVVETCRQQHRNAFAFLTQAVAAHLAHQPAPSLLPGT